MSIGNKLQGQLERIYKMVNVHAQELAASLERSKLIEPGQYCELKVHIAPSADGSLRSEISLVFSSISIQIKNYIM